MKHLCLETASGSSRRVARTNDLCGEIASRTVVSRKPRIMKTLVGLLSLWRARARSRAADRRLLSELAALDDHTLRDIGVNWPYLHREASKPFWRA